MRIFSGIDNLLTAYGISSGESNQRTGHIGPRPGRYTFLFLPRPFS